MDLMNELKITPLKEGGFEMDQPNLPKTPAVYFIYNSKKEVIYIGRTINLYRRTVEHFYQDKWFKLFACYLSYVDTYPEDLARKEHQLICEFTPKYNFEHHSEVTDEEMRVVTAQKEFI